MLLSLNELIGNSYFIIIIIIIEKIEKDITNKIRIMSEIQKLLEDIYENLLPNNEGNVADYIPQLAKVKPDLFGISVCLMDGSTYSVGDTNIDFSIQSCSKPLNYCISRELYGPEFVHSYVGYEPSGREFNAFCLNRKGMPHNPLINSGAMMVCSMLAKDKAPSDQYDYIIQKYYQMSGEKQKVGFDNSVFLSEKQYADRNLSLAYYMRENRSFPYTMSTSKLNEVLNLYFQCCSIKINSQTGAAIASCLANSGMSPVSGERVFSNNTVRDCLALMYSCGMYDFSGQFAFEIGLPAKSGVSGCIFLVIPNIMGVCIYSPRLDELGNSVRGIEVCRQMKKFFNAHVFQNMFDNRIDDKYLINAFIQASADNDLDTMAKLLHRVDINQGDYDKRTALHIAVSENKQDVIEFLEKNGANWDVKDRWGETPVDIHEKNKNDIGIKRRKEDN